MSDLDKPKQRKTPIKSLEELGTALGRPLPEAPAQEDIDETQRNDLAGEESMKLMEDEALAAYGADDESLQALEPRAQIQKLLDVSELRLVSHYDDEIEFVRDAAFERLREYVIDTNEGVFGLFESLRYAQNEGIKDISIVEKIYRNVHSEFVRLSHIPGLSAVDIERGHNTARALSEYVYCARGFLSGETIEGANYLFSQRAVSFAHEVGFPEIAEEDPDSYKPFRLAAGVYASFSDDRSRLYVVDDEETIRHVEDVLSKGLEPSYEEVGQYFARHQAVEIPQELIDIHYGVIDIGVPLDDYLVQKVGSMDNKDALLEKVDDFIVLQSAPVKAIIEEDIGLPLNTLTIREQMFFLDYAKKVTKEDFIPLRDFAHQYGHNGLRTFLTTGSDERLREQVFDFAKSVSEEDAKRVFKAYGGLVGSIDGVGDYLREQFGKESDEATRTIVEKLLDRARNLLKSAHEHKNDPAKLIALVESVQADTRLFTDSCRILKGRGELSLENIRDGSLEIFAGDTINERDAQTMRTVQEAQYQGKYPPGLMDELRSGLADALKNPYSRFYLYRKNGEIVTFVRFDDVVGSDDPQKHMGSFMVNPRFEGGGLGQVLLESALQKESEGGVSIFAECDPSLAGKYQEFGFEILEEYRDSHGVPTLRIQRGSSERLAEAA